MYTARFWNDLHQVCSKSKDFLERQIIQKCLKATNPKGPKQDSQNWHYLAVDHLTCRGGPMVFFFVQNMRVRIFILFVVQSAIFFSIIKHCVICYNQIFFPPPPKSEYFFSNIGNQNIFLEKNCFGIFKLFLRQLYTILLLTYKGR